MADFEKNITGAKAVQDVMRVQGLTPPATISAATDETAKQLWALATEVGQQLITEFDWQFLGREFTITTNGAAEYTLPADWDSFATDASWNRTTTLPVIGSLQDYEWQMLKARTTSGTQFTLLYRLEENQVIFPEAPPSGQTIIIPYVSRAWVEASNGDPQDNLQLDTDVVLYDSQLFKLALKLAWRAEKGFDVTRDQAAFDNQLRKNTGKDGVGRTLSLSRKAGFPYLGYLNIPETGYGS